MKDREEKPKTLEELLECVKPSVPGAQIKEIHEIRMGDGIVCQRDGGEYFVTPILRSRVALQVQIKGSDGRDAWLAFEEDRGLIVPAEET